jgi:hypothetical protein
MPSTTTQSNGHANGSSSTSRPFNNGVYTPLITAMTDDEQVDLEAVKKQVVRLADSGMGIVLLGTNGEGMYRVALACAKLLLPPSERGLTPRFW